MTSIVLIGPRCTGKTEKGKILSSIRAVPFFDADKLFEEKYGSVKDFVNSNGWANFRQVETELLENIVSSNSHRDIVLSPGGGAVAHNQGETYRLKNVSLLRSLGKVAYLLPTEILEESAKILVERMNADPKSRDQRPSLTQAGSQYEEMLSTLKERHELYKNAAHLNFYTRDMTSGQVAWCLTDLIR